MFAENELKMREKKGLLQPGLIIEYWINIALATMSRAGAAAHSYFS